MNHTFRGKSIILRLELRTDEVSFGRVITVINEGGGDVVAIDVIAMETDRTIRDITVTVGDNNDIETILERIKELRGVRLHHVSALKSKNGCGASWTFPSFTTISTAPPSCFMPDSSMR
jgi:acetolactate synthase regulatory subunit